MINKRVYLENDLNVKNCKGTCSKGQTPLTQDLFA